MENEHKGFRIGPIRPPSEANSLLIQVTRGCTWNRCKFCGLYKGTDFKAYSLDSIKQDIDNMKRLSESVLEFKKDGHWDIDGLNRKIRELEYEEQNGFYMLANWYINGNGSVFLQDGNSTVLRNGRLSDAIRYLKAAFPEITRITSYGRAQNLAQISVEEFKELKDAGLDRIHSGYESGSNKVLERVNKGVTQAEEIKAGLNVKAGGIELSIYFMPGLGGADLSMENAIGTSEVLNAVEPDFFRIRTLGIKSNTPLYDDYINGSFKLATEDQKIEEIRYVIEKGEGLDTYVVSDHILNLLQTVEGSLKTDRGKMLKIIDDYLAMDEHSKKLFQAARRTYGLLTPSMMDRLEEPQKKEMEKLVESFNNEGWERYINSVIANYI